MDDVQENMPEGQEGAIGRCLRVVGQAGAQAGQGTAMRQPQQPAGKKAPCLWRILQ